MTTSSKTKLLAPGEGNLLSILGNNILTRVSGRETEGGLWIMEYTVAPGFAGPPAHVHRRTHEIFYVVEGVLGMLVDSEEHLLKEGGLALVAPGTSHSFFNRSSRLVRYMGILTPSDAEGYFEELPEVVAKHGYPPPADIMATLGAKYDIAIAAAH